MHVFRIWEKTLPNLALVTFTKKNRPVLPTPKRRVKTEQFCNRGAGGGDISVDFVPVSLFNNSTEYVQPTLFKSTSPFPI